MCVCVCRNTRNHALPYWEIGISDASYDVYCVDRKYAKEQKSDI